MDQSEPGGGFLATLEQTLQIFSELLASEQPANVAEADEAVWAYLAAAQGLEAQIVALGQLESGAASLNAGSAFMPVLRDALERHRARLAEASA